MNRFSDLDCFSDIAVATLAPLELGVLSPVDDEDFVPFPPKGVGAVLDRGGYDDDDEKIVESLTLPDFLKEEAVEAKFPPSKGVGAFDDIRGKTAEPEAVLSWAFTESPNAGCASLPKGVGALLVVGG